MLGHVLKTLIVPTSVAAGTRMDITDVGTCAVQAVNGGVAWNGTANIQVSVDGEMWTNVGTALSDGSYQVLTQTIPAKFIRINTTAYTAGSLVCKLGGNTNA